MQGMRFLLLNEKGIPVNHGQILQKITDDRFLCYFARKPAVSRVCNLDEIALWNLFPDDDAQNEFLLAVQARTGEEQKPVETNDEPIATIEPEESEDVE